MEKKTYILCPRCELNYMDSREKYCDVCKAELGIGEASFLLPEEEDESEGKLCPICHTNYCEDGEDMCIECKKERAAKDKEEEETDNWHDDDEAVAEMDDDIMEKYLMGEEIPIGDLDEEEEQEEDETPEADDFEYINPDDFSGDDDDEDDDEDDGTF